MLSFYIFTVFIVTVAARSPPMLGGVHETEETEEVRAAAHFATNEINTEIRDSEDNWFTLTDINNPTVQVVRGFMYRMEIVLRESECLNEDNNAGASVQQCGPQRRGSTRRCNISVLRGLGNEGYSLWYHQCTTDQ